MKNNYLKPAYLAPALEVEELLAERGIATSSSTSISDLDMKEFEERNDFDDFW